MDVQAKLAPIAGSTGRLIPFFANVVDRPWHVAGWNETVRPRAGL
jgi:hypothetical protein